MAENIKITLPDGVVKEYPSGVNGEKIAKDISEGLARVALSIKVNGDIYELSRPITEDANIQILTWRDQEGKETMWHSSAHILAEAIEELYPGAKLGFGPPIERGFYYDIDFGDHEFNQDDFAKVEKRFLELARSGETFERVPMSKAEALAHYKEKGNEYKVELIEGLEDGTITFYHSGNFVDLCKGGHIPNSKSIKAVKILNTAGAYWRGDENNKQLTRLYAISFPKKKELDEHLEMLEEAKKRDHRKVGKEMELFTFSEKVGMGLPMWLPKGTRLRETLVDFLKKVQEKGGYEQVITPHIGKKDLYVTSGHYEKYGEDSFQPINTPHEGEEFLLKPMNCPHHCEIYKTRPRSYRELPLRLAEFGTVYRYEQSGELHGLTRVRGFTQDDAHIFCRPDQVKDEFKKVLIFSATKKMADLLAEEIQSEFGDEFGIIHSNKSQNFRFGVIRNFKSGEYRFIIATDVVARGIDVSEVSHVINFDVPDEAENYIHRIGRTGRADQKGNAISFITE
ncbi:MAG: threonine--tRNA ligase, partial [Bacteroidota bacterium]